MLNRLRYYIRNYFGFTKRETNGVIVIMFLMVILCGSFFYLQDLMFGFHTAKLPASETQMAMIDQWNALYPPKSNQANQEQKTEVEVAYFNFDPNTVSKEELISLGFSDKLSQTLINFRNKGGEFREKEDLQKVYGMSEALYDKLEDYIVIPEQNTPKKFQADRRSTKQVPTYQRDTAYTPPPQPKKIEAFVTTMSLNEADSLSLTSVRGIGPALSSRIIKYRESMGGFIREEQLEEIYGLREDVKEALLERFYIEDGFEPKQININLATAEELAKHPYITYKLANILVAYREQHGAYRDADDLLNIKVIKKDFVGMIAPYLSFK